MPRVVISVEERRELEQELGRLEAERQTLTNQIHWARAQDSKRVEDLELHDALDDLTLVEGRIQQLQAVLAAAKTPRLRIDLDPRHDG